MNKGLILNAYKQKSIQIDHINVFGIRNDEHMEDDLYNDHIGILTDSGDFYLFKGSTDPGVHYTENPLNSNGCAHLIEGYYKNAYIVGKHKGYEALVQQGNKVQVWRDRDKDFKDNDGIKQWGYFGINIHYGNDKDFIRYSSAGCQIIQYKKDFDEFMDIIRSSRQKHFSYLLLNKNELK
jgi:hypothetical protein